MTNQLTITDSIDPTTLAKEQASKGLLYRNTSVNPLYELIDEFLSIRKEYQEELLRDKDN